MMDQAAHELPWNEANNGKDQGAGQSKSNKWIRSFRCKADKTRRIAMTISAHRTNKGRHRTNGLHRTRGLTALKAVSAAPATPFKTCRESNRF